MADFCYQNSASGCAEALADNGIVGPFAIRGNLNGGVLFRARTEDKRFYTVSIQTGEVDAVSAEQAAHWAKSPFDRFEYPGAEARDTTPIPC